MVLLWRHVFNLLGLGLSTHGMDAKPVVDSAPAPFQIDGFAASGYPYKTPTGYLFWVEQNITVRAGEGHVWCYAWERTHTTDMSIQNITTIPCQEDNAITWSFVKGVGGFNFSVAWQYTGHAQLAGSAWIPDSEIQWLTENNNAVQKYVGPASFSVPTQAIFTGM